MEINSNALNIVTNFLSEYGSEIASVGLTAIVAFLFPNSKAGKIAAEKTGNLIDYLKSGYYLYNLSRKLGFLSGMTIPNIVEVDDPIIKKAMVSLAIGDGYSMAVKQVLKDNGYDYNEVYINGLTKVVSITRYGNKSLSNSTTYVVAVPTIKNDKNLEVIKTGPKLATLNN